MPMRHIRCLLLNCLTRFLLIVKLSQAQKVEHCLPFLPMEAALLETDHYLFRLLTVLKTIFIRERLLVILITMGLKKPFIFPIPEQKTPSICVS